MVQGGCLMRRIRIKNNLQNRDRKITLGVLYYKVNVVSSSDEIENRYDDIISVLKDKYLLQSIVENSHIKSTRLAYTSFGKNPSRYRNAAEGMLRRIVKGNGLYRINNIVNINNMMSITTGYSIGSYSVNKLTENIVFKLAEKGEKYLGIGKESVNIEFLPTLYDDNGAFGNPTSDSQRTMIKEGEQEIISVIYSFDDDGDMKETMAQFASMLKKYTDIREIDTWIA